MGDYVSKAKAEEQFQRHKSREQGISIGDSNTKFFFRSVQMRRVANKITYLLEGNRNMLEEVDKIGACKTYCKELYAQDVLLDVDFRKFQDINSSFSISEDIVEFLQAKETRVEVQGVLADIHDDDAPGNEGYTSFFFKVTWDIIGVEFVKAIQNFFHSGNCLEKLNQHV